MEGFFLLIILGAVISYTILYFVIKAAVRNAIIEARNVDSTTDSTPVNFYSDESRIAQKACQNYDKNYDCDFPKCPYCGYQD